MANATYANARAKSLEKYLLGEERLNRMIESSSAEDALKILSEVNFGEGVVIDSPLDFEQLLDAETNKLYKFIKETGASDTLVKFLLLKNDFHNAQCYIRAKYLKIDVENMLTLDGTIKKEDMKEKIAVDEYKSFPSSLQKALMTADLEFVSNKATGRSIDNVFKKELYNELNNVSKQDKTLKEIYNIKADCINVAVALRTRNYAVANGMFVSGGTLDNDLLKAFCEQPLEVLKEKCRFNSNSEILLSAIEGAIKNQPLSDFENIADSYAVSLLKKEKYSTEGLHPFLLYVFYKLAEIQNVRIIMVGQINGIGKTEIKRRLRKGYEG